MHVSLRLFFVGILSLLWVGIAQSTQASNLPHYNGSEKASHVEDWKETSPSTRSTLLDRVAATSVAIKPKIVSSFMVPGNRALAITWGNNSLWLADANKNVYRLNANGEEIQPSFPITFTPRGLAWDGSHLWSGDQAATWQSKRIYQLDNTGKVIKTIFGNWDYYEIDSLVWVDGNLYVTDSYADLVRKIDPSGKHLLSWQVDFFGGPRGITYDGTALWVGTEICNNDFLPNALYRYTLLGERLNMVNLNPIGINCKETQLTIGLAWDGKFLWYTGDDIFTVYKLDIGVPDLAVSPTQLSFGAVAIGSTAAQTITVQNKGTTHLPFTGITVSKDFAQTNTCPGGGATVTGGASCTIRVTFTPVALESRTGVITITNYADVTPQTVNLTGSGMLGTKVFTLQINQVGNGTVNANPSGLYTSGQVVTLTATPDSGWTFAGWSGDLTGINNPATFNITKNTTIVANFTAPCFTLTLTHTGSGSDPVATPANSPSCTVGQYTADTALSLSASPTAGWQVKEWSGTANNATTAISNSLTMPSTNHTVGVTYTEATASITKTWTLLIYAVGDNDQQIVKHFQLMLSRFNGAAPQSNVNVGILYDGTDANDTAHHILRAGGNSLERFPIAEARMDETATLREFVKWGFATLPPSDYYYLAIADHANGVVGIGLDRTTDSTGNAWLTPAEVRTALQEAVANSSHKLNIVHFDGCSFGLFENTSIVEGLADYVIASPNTGWGIFAYDQYHTLAGQVSNDPATFAKAVAQTYANKLNGLPYTISVFDMAHYTDLRAATDELGDTLVNYLKPDPPTYYLVLRDSVRKNVQKYDSSGGDLQITETDAYVDLPGLAKALKLLGQPVITAAADKVMAAAGAFTHFKLSNTGQIDGQLIELSSTQGLGIYYPYSTRSKEYPNYIGDTIFPNLTKPTATESWGWRDFLASLPPPVLPDPRPDEAPLIPPLIICNTCQIFLPLIER